VDTVSPVIPVTLNCAELTTREINTALRELPDGAGVMITEPRGRHNLAVGLTNSLDITIDGNAGYYTGGLCQGPDITVKGFVGWGVGENLMSGTIRVLGSASQSVGSSAHGGLIVIEGDASLRAGISLKGGTIAIAGDAGSMCAFMAQAGTILVGGNAGAALGDSLYEAVIYVAGTIASLGADARIEEMDDDDMLAVKHLVELTGFDHIEPGNVKKVTSARNLYHFDSANFNAY
jgi:methylamine---glutamate N-methyltransferase subunit B